MLHNNSNEYPQRFFLWVHCYDPHHEYEPHPEVPSFGTGKVDLYDQEIRYTYLHVGRLLDDLKARGLWDKTIIVDTGLAMIPLFAWPDATQLTWLVLSGLVDGSGQICLLLATRNAAATLVGVTHYSQLLWAVAIGALFFGEWPDPWMLIGLGAIMTSGALAVAAARRARG